jgi:hypothetical protein
MAGEAGARPLLPQTAQLQSFGFVQQQPPPPARQEQQRSTIIATPIGAFITDQSLPDYVFVDEHNRHKRLKGNSQTVSNSCDFRADRSG